MDILIIYNNCIKLVTIFDIEKICNIMSAIGTLGTLIATVIIARKNSKQVAEQNKKILYDNKMQRLTNYHSNVILSDSPLEIKYDVDEIKQYSNFAHLVGSNMTNLVEFKFMLKSISNVFPTQIKIEDFLLWNTDMKNECVKKDLIHPKVSGNYNDTGIIEDDNIILLIWYGMSIEEKNKIIEWTNIKNYINFEIKLKIKNQVNIETELVLNGIYKYKENEYILQNKRQKIIKMEEISNE